MASNPTDRLRKGFDGFAIRSEGPDDGEAISALVYRAFVDHSHSQQTEHRIVETLREAGALSLSLVGLVDGVIVGHVAASEITLDGQACRWWLIGPLAICPGRQGQGLGSVLMNRVIEVAKATGLDGLCLVGEPAYYGRFGFAADANFVVDGIPSGYVLTLPLTAPVSGGRIEPHPAFSIEPDMTLILYHNPACSTSRKVLALIKEAGLTPVVVDYLKNPLTRTELIRLAGGIEGGVRAMLREKAEPYQSLGLADPQKTDDQLLDALVEHPILLNRPIAASAKGVRVCRPVERIFEILPDQA